VRQTDGFCYVLPKRKIRTRTLFTWGTPAVKLESRNRLPSDGTKQLGILLGGDGEGAEEEAVLELITPGQTSGKKTAGAGLSEKFAE
jgi:hypothetical protein